MRPAKTVSFLAWDSAGPTALPETARFLDLKIRTSISLPPNRRTTISLGFWPPLGHIEPVLDEDWKVTYQ